MDFGRLLAALLGGTDGAAAAGHAAPPLRDETLTEMLANHYRPYPAMPGAAYGFFEGDARGCRALHHTGDGGDHSLLYLLPDAGIGFFLVYSTPGRGDAVEVREAFTSRFLDRILGPKAPPIAAPPPAGGLGQYVGVYRNNQYAHDTVEKVAAMPRQMMIGAADTALTVQLGIGGPRFRLTPAGGDLFRDPDGAYVGFHRAADGAVDGLSFNGGLVDDPGSASRIGWSEDARLHLATLGATVALALLGLVGRLAAVLARRRRRRRLQAPQPAEPMYRLARRLATMTAGLAALVAVALGATLVSLQPPITSVPPGVYLALALLTTAAGAGLTILPAAAVAIYNRQGPRLGRAYLVALGLACYAAIGVLAYWHLLGWQT